MKPAANGWVSRVTANSVIRPAHTDADFHLGSSLDINRSGTVIVAGAAGIATSTTHAGAAFVYYDSGADWSTAFITDVSSELVATLSDDDSANGSQFGSAVAVSDSGDEVAVGNARAGHNTHVFKRDGATWADDAEADYVLTGGTYFGTSLAIDGENSLVVGQPERNAANSPASTGHGQAYAFDLSATNVQASSVPLDGKLGVCSSRLLDGTTTWTCPVYINIGTTDTDKTAGQITIPAGTPDGTFTISANFTVDAKTNITAVLPITIGKVDEAASATFGPALNPGDPTISGDPAEKPYPTEIAAGENTRLLLRILNSEGKPAGAGAVSAVLFTTNQGTLSLLNPVGAVQSGGTCNLTCQVDVSKLNAANTGAIAIQVAHPGAGKSGIGTVRAQVLTSAGSGQLSIDPVAITFSGAASTLTISEAATGVLNVNTASGAEGTDDEKDARETRDSIRLSVSATDASGNKADVPTAARSTTIKGPDGTVVWRSSTATGTFEVRWPLQKAGATATSPDVDDLDSAGNLQVEVDVDALATAKLAGGVYTLEVKAGSLTQTQTFTVSGGVANIEFSEPDGELTLGGRFTLTATFTDADGGAVPNGTEVEFKEVQSSAAQVVVVVRKGTTTKDGEASATYQVVNTGRVSIRAGAGDAGNITLITITEVAEEPAAPTNPADSLTPKMPNEYSSWLGEGTTSASALLDGLGDGFGTILRWYNGEWLRYGVVDGRKIPGAVDFEVTTGAILWLGGGN